MTQTIRTTAVRARQGEHGGRAPVVVGVSATLVIVAFVADYAFTAFHGAQP